jgi:diguanylate cyclase (GGDEF)-like protein/PAS domain S-box-containing protein
MGHPTRQGSILRARPAQSAGRLRAVLASMRDLVLIRDAAGLLTYCSPSVLDALGYQPRELEGTPERDLIHPSDLEARNDLVTGSDPGGAPLPALELRMRDRSGEWHWFEVIEANRLDDRDVAGIVTIARDASVHKAERAELLERSLRDPLTAIPNRLALIERLQIALSRASRARDIVAVLFCDVDDFKLINDVYGHDFADGVLIEVARRLDHLQRSSDTVARIGGDEFVIVCDGLHDIDESTVIASRVHRVVEEPISIGGRECRITMSIGIATIDGGAAELVDPTTLLRNADVAMYRAKQQGRAHWHRFDDSLARETTQRAELEAALAPALEHGEFVVHYQPIHELAGRTIVGVEGFLHWEHPTRGFLRPRDFLDAAEQNGMIVPIGAWAMRKACNQARLWRDAGWPGWMSVNISGRELAEPGLSASIATTLDETGVAPDQLWLELEESVFMRAGRSATTELTSLQNLGVHIGVDSFGTAHVPLPKLQQWPTDFVKIDSGFVANLTEDGDIHPAGCDMVAALVQVGTKLGLSVLAEGIQSEIETSLLVECGCEYGQGDLLAQPPRAGARTMQRL